MHELLVRIEALEPEVRAGQIVAHLDAPGNQGPLGLRNEHRQPVAILHATPRGGGLELRDAAGHMMLREPIPRPEEDTGSLARNR